MVASRKIPPHIARELARHVKSSKPTSAIISNNGKTGENREKQYKTLLGCFAFIGVTASMPLVAMEWIGPLNEKDGALTGGQIRRGAFNNSGSRDVGRTQPGLPCET